MAVIVGPTLAKLLEGLPPAYGLKQRSEADMPFLRLLYAQTREDELAPVPWTAQQKEAFLADQFNKQHSHYLQHYPQAQWPPDRQALLGANPTRTARHGYFTDARPSQSRFGKCLDVFTIAAR